MKITIESTDRLVRISGRDCPADCEIPGRVWEGTTDTGIQVVCVITRIATPATEDQTHFQKELQECRPPLVEEVFPLRMII